MGFQGKDNFRTEQHHAAADTGWSVVSTAQLLNITLPPASVFKYVEAGVFEKMILHCR